jgi:hypothetical protein
MYLLYYLHSLYITGRWMMDLREVSAGFQKEGNTVKLEANYGPA